MAPSFDPASGQEVGFWGLPTATVDWCEENYAVTQYAAEFWNTVSNLAMIVPGIYAAWASFSNGYEWRSVYSFFALAVVGIGSWFFHMTMLYSMQLFDEIPMTFSATFLNYSLIEISREKGSVNKTLLAALITYFVVTSVVYLIIKVHLFFLLAYSVMVTLMVVFSVLVYMRHDSNPRLLLLSLTSYMSGFVLWNIENNMCGQVRELRAYLPLAVTPVTQLHAWWHILAGVGTYLSVLYATDARLRILRKEPKLFWYCSVFPFVDCASTHKIEDNNNMAGSVSNNEFMSTKETSQMSIDKETKSFPLSRGTSTKQD